MYFLNFLYNNLLLGRIFLLVFNSEMDTASPWQYNFSDPATPIMEGIINFHNDLMFFIVAIIIFVVWVLFRCVQIFLAPTGDQKIYLGSQKGVLGFLALYNNIKIKNTNESTKDLLSTVQIYSDGINHHTPIEIAWTVTPAFILMIIAVPSFALLYSIEAEVQGTDEGVAGGFDSSSNSTDSDWDSDSEFDSSAKSNSNGGHSDPSKAGFPIYPCIFGILLVGLVLKAFFFSS